MSLFGVYDGHGGAEVAEWISKKFPNILKKEIEDEKIDLNEAFGKRIQEIFVKTGNIGSPKNMTPDSYAEEYEADAIFYLIPDTLALLGPSGVPRLPSEISTNVVK